MKKPKKKKKSGSVIRINGCKSATRGKEGRDRTVETIRADRKDHTCTGTTLGDPTVKRVSGCTQSLKRHGVLTVAIKGPNRPNKLGRDADGGKKKEEKSVTKGGKGSKEVPKDKCCLVRLDHSARTV